MQISANGVLLEVDDRGPVDAEPLVLIMGLGMQLLAWPDGFVDQLVARGFRVIRFDNRDIGLSQHFDHLGVPKVTTAAVRHMLHMPVKSPYGISDMADDTAALIETMGLGSAHICGASMGGMIAQQLAVRHPEQVRSLTLMMTTSGARQLPQAGWKVRMALLKRPADAQNVDSVIDQFVQLYGVIGSPGYRPDQQLLRQRLHESVQRSYHPDGTMRQLMAILADGDRTSLLAQIRQPTMVVHGLADPLVPVEAGRDLARRISGATTDFIEGMGHDLPQPLWARFAADIGSGAGR